MISVFFWKNHLVGFVLKIQQVFHIAPKLKVYRLRFSLHFFELVLGNGVERLSSQSFFALGVCKTEWSFVSCFLIFLSSVFIIFKSWQMDEVIRVFAFLYLRSVPFVLSFSFVHSTFWFKNSSEFKQAVGTTIITRSTRFFLLICSSSDT